MNKSPSTIPARSGGLAIIFYNYEDELKNQWSPKFYAGGNSTIASNFPWQSVKIKHLHTAVPCFKATQRQHEVHKQSQHNHSGAEQDRLISQR